jgi:hypothetical protein
MTVDPDTNITITDIEGGKFWFEASKASGFGIVLPSGWLGRPFDNQHEIDEYHLSNDEIFFRCDDRREFLIKSPKSIFFSKSSTGRTNITFCGFDEVKYTWYPEPDEKKNPKITIFKSGELTLVGYNVYL